MRVDDIYDLPSDVYDDDGKRIGIMTPGGGFLIAADDDTMTDYAERKAADRAAERKRLKEEHKLRKAQRMAHLLNLWEIDPRYAPGTLNDLTISERRIVERALSDNDFVSLAWVVKHTVKLKDMAQQSLHSIEQEMHRAASRLYNRGLATVEKMDDGLIWVRISRERVLDLVRRDLAERQQGAGLNFNLMKEHCEIPTSLSGQENEETKQVVKRLPTDLPKRASPYRLESCRRLKGVRMLQRPDKVAINWQFERYISDINDKIITLLDISKGELVGSEYSTRFNDLAKAAANLDKFDIALENSFFEHKSAVFLTLTTDPNLTDEEREQNRRRSIAEVESKLRKPGLDPKAREALTKRYYRLMGPDYEISEIETRLKSGLLSSMDAHNLSTRLAKLQAYKIKAAELQAQVDDPATPPRTRERMILSIKKMGRWTYKHDPEGHQCLWDANRSFSPAWNRFLAFLTKKNSGKRPQYIAAYEYTESGLMHVHALIFTDYLLNNDDISMEWIRCGQGEITYIYSLKATKNRQGDGWEWRWNSQSRPNKATGMSGGDYLKKYVKKCMLAIMDDYTAPAETQSLYWALNKRMFTCSRALQEPVADPEKEGESAYIFYKVMYSVEAEDSVDRMIYHRIHPTCKDPPDDLAEVGV